MQTIADKYLALAVHTETIVASLVEGLKDHIADTPRRMREERGVAAVEYAGVLLIVGLIFAAIFALNLPDNVGRWAKKVVTTVNKNGGCDGGADTC
jgi:Flp pilus assembly pilin Flp